MTVIWRVEMLGQLQVWSKKQTHTRFQTRKTGIVLARLAMPVGQIYDRVFLAESIWSNTNPQSARENLRTALNALRRQLEPPGVQKGQVLEATRSTLRLRPETVATDVAQFDALLAKADKEKANDQQRTLLTEAVALYRGHLLPGYYEDWIVGEQQRRAGQFVGALRQLVALYEQMGDIERASLFAARVVQEEPSCEEDRYALIRLYLAQNQIATALKQYEAWKLLIEEEKISPSPAMNALVANIPSAKSKVTVSSDTSIPDKLTSPPTQEPTKAQDFPLVAPPSVPLRFTKFFGRETELDTLANWLQPSSAPCLITLTGPGGTGKTRLAQEVAARFQVAFDEAVWYVPLGDISDDDLLPDTILKALNLPSTQQQPLEQIVSYLATRAALLVLDNFEHLGASATAFLVAMRDRLPSLALLVTSRRVLGIAGEQEYALAPLDIPIAPGTPEQLLTFASVQLLVNRAQSVRPDFQLTPRNAATIVEICQRLEGLPLAIELAASWIWTISFSQLLQRLSRRFNLLVSKRKDLPARQRSLYATIAWSYDQLTDELKSLFVRCASFRGGWTLEAAEQVCELPEALHGLRQLHQHSLLTVEEQGETMRYRMLETLREFALEQLTEMERKQLGDRHASYFLDLAESAADRLDGPEQLTWLDRLDADHDNLRSALMWLQETEKVDRSTRMVIALTGFWATRGHVEEGRRYVRQQLTRSDRSVEDQAELLYSASFLSQCNDAFTESNLYLEKGVDLARSLSNDLLIARFLFLKGYNCRAAGLTSEARQALEESLQLFEEHNVRFWTAKVLHALGGLLMDQNEIDLAYANLTVAFELFRDLGNVRRQALALIPIGHLATIRGERDQARAHYERSLAIFSEYGDRALEAVAQTCVSKCEVYAGEHERARALLETALATSLRLGARAYEAQALRDLGELEYQLGNLRTALEFYRQSLNLMYEIGQRQHIPKLIFYFSLLLANQGNYTEVALALGVIDRALRETEKTRIAYEPEECRQHEELIATTRTTLGEESFTLQWQKGKASPFDDSLPQILKRMETIVIR